MQRVWSCLFAALILATGVGSSLWLGSGLFARIADLNRHMQSKDWNVSGGNATLDAAIRALHPEQNDLWPIHFVAGSGNSFPLGDEARRDTITDLANHAPVAGVVFSRQATTISQAYSNLVSEAAIDPSISMATRTAAVALISKYKWDLDDFPSYPTDTNPSADSIALWEQATVSLPQSSKCRGSVEAKMPLGLDSGQLSSTSQANVAARKALSITAPIPVDIGIMQRYGIFQIVRPWVERNLLSAAARSPNMRINQFFRQNGALAEIPDALVVVMPDQVVVSPEGSYARASLRGLVQSGLCCHVKCLGADFNLEDGVEWASAGALNGKRKYPRPSLYAIIAHRELRQ